MRICFLTYRGNPQCGGQGIYTRHLTGALAALGHEVEVWSGPPYPELHDGVGLHRVPSLDLWDEQALFRRPSFAEIRDPIHRSEWLRTLTGQFPEPHTFSRRVLRDFGRLGRQRGFDVVHDNQCLGEGLLPLRRQVPVVATIHHPITVDRDIAMAAARTRSKRWGLRRWYSFLDKQIAVAPQLDDILTVSEAAAEGIERDFRIERHRMHVVPNGVDLDVFRPLPGVARLPHRLIATISATNAPLKGFVHLLEALAIARREIPDVTLTVIGKEGDRTARQRIRDLGLGDAVRITGRVTTDEMVALYAESTIAIVPSLYEGFGLPAIEAMACRVPVISTNAGALPEVVGRDGHAGVLVQAGRGESLARPIVELLRDPDRREALAEAGRVRATTLFTWRRAAELCVEVYREAIARRQPHGDRALRAAC